MRVPTALCAAACLAFGATPAIDPNRYLDDVKFLASPELKGRATGSPELEKAADFIAKRFKEFGLQPAGDKAHGGASYYQAFPVTTSAQLGKGNRLRVTEKGHSEQL